MGRQTPTVSRFCEYDYSLYEEALELYEKNGLEAYEWQKKLLKPIMAIADEGYWAHFKCGYSISRRNGKTEISYLLEIWGLYKGLNVLHTAHRISTSHSSFNIVKSYLEKMVLEDSVNLSDIIDTGE